MKKNGSVIRIFSILEIVSKHPDGITLGDIYRKLGMAKATAYDILQTLYHLDAVYYKDPHLKNYVIGSKVYAIGSVYTNNSNLISVSDKYLKRFSEKTGYTTQLTKRLDDKIVYVYKYEPSNMKIITETDVGTIYYDYKSDISGKCYRAFDENALDVEMADYEQIVEQGYVTELNGSTCHIRNFSVPIRNFENKICGAIVASDLEQEGSDYTPIIKELIKKAKKISRGLGYLGDSYE